MKTITTVLLALIISYSAHSQTNVSGGILSNTTWTSSGNPYIVTGNVVVFEGVTLNIAPGVIIKFDAGTGIELRGKLNAIGNGTANIVFTSNSNSPSIGSWTGITVVGTSDPVAVGNQVTMEYCTCEYAHYFVNLDLAYHGPYIFRHCNFKKNHQVNYSGGLPSTIFENCRFESNDLALGSCQFSSRVSHSDFINNVNGVDGIETIDTCFFSGNTGVALSPYGSTTGCIIENNNVGVSSTFNAVNHLFKENTVTNNSIGVEILSYFNGSINFTGNTICNNTIYDVKLLQANNADLSGNCWCTADSASIRSGIYDGYTDFSYGLVNFMPFTTGCPQNLGINENLEALNTMVYPNPFTDKVTISCDEKEAVEITVMDLAGRKMIQTEFTASMILNTEPFPQGVYFFRIQNKKGSVSTGKLIKN